MSLQILIKEVEEEFCTWMQMKKNMYNDLVLIADEIDEDTKNCRVAKISGSSLGVVGGTLAVIGFGLSFATFGAAIPLAIAGASIAATGGVASGGSTIAQMYLHSKLRGRALENLKQSREFLEKLADHITEVSNLLVPDQNDVETTSLPPVYVEDGEADEDGDTTTTVVTGGKYLAKASNFTNNMVSFSSAGGQMALATSQALTVFGGVVNIVLLPLEVYGIVETALALHHALPEDSSTLVRAIAKEFNPESDEVNYTTTDTIREKFVMLQILTVTDISKAVELWQELCNMMNDTQVNAHDIIENLDGILKKAKKKGINIDEEVEKFHTELKEAEENADAVKDAETVIETTDSADDTKNVSANTPLVELNNDKEVETSDVDLTSEKTNERTEKSDEKKKLEGERSFPSINVSEE